MFRSNNVRTELTRMIRIELGQIKEMSSTEIGQNKGHSIEKIIII